MRSTRLPSWIERFLGLDPVAPPPHVFAIDHDELRYGRFHHSPQGMAFETCRREPLPEDLVTPGLLGAPFREPKMLWEVLQRLVGEVEGPIEHASLVLPDSWLRLTFTESGELPKGQKERDEVLRFMLKRLVPFRVEDLRLSTHTVTPFPNQEAPLRIMIGFAIEALVKQLEEAFRGVGIELGQITNNTLALLSGLEHLVAPDELAALMLVERDDYTLSYLYGGEVLLYRYKAFGDAGEQPAFDAAASIDAGAVRRDLRMTSSFIGRHFPARTLSRVFLAAPQEGESDWLDWLADELDIAPEALGFEHFPLSRTQAGESWLVTGPLLGAASIEVT